MYMHFGVWGRGGGSKCPVSHLPLKAQGEISHNVKDNLLLDLGTTLLAFKLSYSYSASPLE